MGSSASNRAARSAFVLGRLFFPSSCFLCIVAPVAAQSIKLPARGAAYALARGPSIAVSVRRAADGSDEARFILDQKTPRSAFERVAIKGGVRYRQKSSLEDAKLGKVNIKSELDVLGPNLDLSYDLMARITWLDKTFEVASLGIEFEFRNVRGEQAVMIPTFSGGEFLEPAASIPPNSPIDTGVSCSLQVTAYYGDDGSGLLIYARDRAATKPKHFVYQTSPGSRSLRISLEFYPPINPLGGNKAETLAKIHVQPYKFNPGLEPGWYRPAKIYRAWLMANARVKGGILERGALRTRPDIPKWMKELDLLVSEQYGWYPFGAKVPAPLFALRRLQRDLNAKRMLVGLWFSYDRSSILGRFGSWLPHIGTSLQAKSLLPDNIRIMGYVAPWSFDLKNPLLDAFGLRAHTVEDRAGKPLTFAGSFDPILMKPNMHVQMDVAAPELAEWFWLLGAYHSTVSGFSGFFVDAPAMVGVPDFRRPAGKALGTTEAAFQGFGNILRRTQEGARLFQRDFVHLHEAAFEWLIPNAAAQGATGVLGRAFPNEARTRGIPFFQTVYSGYTMFWPADEGLGTQTLAFLPEAYGPMQDSNMSRLLAEGFTWGTILNSSELNLAEGKLFYELDIAEPAKSMFQHHKTVLKNLIALRARARPWLVYGEMLNNPVVAGDMVDVHVQLLFGSKLSNETFKKIAVPTTAWRAADRSIRLVAANGSRTKKRVTVDLKRIGLSGDYELVDIKSRSSFGPSGKNGTITFEVPGGQGRLLVPVAKR